MLRRTLTVLAALAMVLVGSSLGSPAAAAGPTVSGVVKAQAGGAPIAGAEVRVVYLNASAWVQPIYVVADENGQFTADLGVPPQLDEDGIPEKPHVAFMIAAPGFELTTTNAFSAEGQLFTLLLRPAAAVTGVVRGPSGPVPGATVTFQNPTDPFAQTWAGWGYLTPVTTQADGRFLMGRVPTLGQLKVTAPDFEEAYEFFTMSAGETLDVEIDLTPVVPAAPGKPSVSGTGADRTVTWEAVSSAASYRVRSRVDGGSWQESDWQAGLSRGFNSLPPGTWEFAVKARTSAAVESAWSATSDPVVVAAAPAPVTPASPASNVAPAVQPETGASTVMPPLTTPKVLKKGKRVVLPPQAQWRATTKRTCSVVVRGGKPFLVGKSKGKCVLVSVIDGRKARHAVKIR